MQTNKKPRTKYWQRKTNNPFQTCFGLMHDLRSWSEWGPFYHCQAFDTVIPLHIHHRQGPIPPSPHHPPRAQRKPEAKTQNRPNNNRSEEGHSSPFHPLEILSKHTCVHPIQAIMKANGVRMGCHVVSRWVATFSASSSPLFLSLCLGLHAVRQSSAKSQMQMFFLAQLYRACMNP